jgi:DNA-binding phage protein
MSYRFGSKSRKDRIAARFVSHVHAVLSRAALETRKEQGVTQAQVARELGVDRSFITRLLSGAGNPTVRTIGELAGALGYRPELVLHKVDIRPGTNHVNREVKAVSGAGGATVVVSSPQSGASAGNVTAYEHSPKARTAELVAAL